MKKIKFILVMLFVSAMSTITQAQIEHDPESELIQVSYVENGAAVPTIREVKQKLIKELMKLPNWKSFLQKEDNFYEKIEIIGNYQNDGRGYELFSWKYTMNYNKDGYRYYIVTYDYNKQTNYKGEVSIKPDGSSRSYKKK